MEYIKAQNVLPDELIEEIQKYVTEQYIYIPTERGTRKKWGEKSGTREHIAIRNKEIRDRYKNGDKIAVLAEDYYLSLASIRKIIYSAGT